MVHSRNINIRVPGYVKILIINAFEYEETTGKMIE